MENASPPPTASPPLILGALPLPLAAAPAPSRRPMPVWLGVTALLLGVFAVLLWWWTNNRFGQIEREFARRIQVSDSVSAESRVLSKQAVDQSMALQAKVGVLEAKLADSQSQQASLEELYQDLSRTRDDWALTEVEQILSVASQQLQLAGNVQGALIALQSADNRLARADKPQFIPLRRVLAHDMDRLKALPSVDLAGNALRLDSLVGMVDGLPLLADEKPAPPPRLDSRVLDRAPRMVTDKDGKTTAAPASWGDRAGDALRYTGAELWQQFQELVRIRDVRTPDALLLTPSQSYFVRENLKLRLLNARLALLARQESIYRSDLIRVQDMLSAYFDTRARQTVAAQAVLSQLEASNTVIELPTLGESLAAVRNFRPPREH